MVTLAAAVVTLLFAQASAPVPPGWRIVPAVRPGTVPMRCAESSRPAWRVSVSSRDGVVSISPGGDRSERDSVVLPDGQLVGYDHGEFGGQILWVGADGSATVLTYENLVSFQRRADTILAFVGLAHGASMEGRLLALTRKPSGWAIDTLARLDDAPAAVFQVSPTTYLVAATGALLSIEASGRVETLVANEAWGGIYPSSVARDRNGVTYVGMRGVVARVLPGRRPRVQWLAPDSSPCFR